MFGEGSQADLTALAASPLYPVVVGGFLIATSLALASDYVWVGVGGVLLTSLLALVYGAAQTTEGTD